MTSKCSPHSWTVVLPAVTLQRLAEELDDANHCEGSEVISNLTEESGVVSAANCEAKGCHTIARAVCNVYIYIYIYIYAD